jgi:acetyltransferase
VAIVTNAGGPGILCTDACIGRGLELSELGPATRRALRRALPPEAAIDNPVDMIASADASHYRAVLDRVMRDRAVDGVIAIFVSPIMIDALEVARAIAAAAHPHKPMLSVFMGKQRSQEGEAELRARRVPIYRFPEDAASAMSALVRYRALRDAPQGSTVGFRVRRAAGQAAVASARAAGRLALDAEETRRLLEAYGFPVVPGRVVADAAQAIAAAQELGYPVVLKAASPALLHKSDVGGVRVDLRHADEVGQAFRDLTRRLGRRDPALRVLVQRMVRGREVILGVTRDPQFGPLVMFGLGGVFVEVLRDVAVRIHPLTDVDASSMVRSIRGFALLAGHRGEPGVDVELIEETLLRLSQLVGDLEDDLAELDLNPLIVNERREESFVVDARVLLTPRD